MSLLYVSATHRVVHQFGLFNMHIHTLHTRAFPYDIEFGSLGICFCACVQKPTHTRARTHSYISNSYSFYRMSLSHSNLLRIEQRTTPIVYCEEHLLHILYGYVACVFDIMYVRRITLTATMHINCRLLNMLAVA